MNKLSWLIYFSNIVENLSTFFEVWLWIFFISLVIAFVISLIRKCDENIDDGLLFEWMRKKGTIILITIVLIDGLTSFIPDKQTILLIAASQTTEMVYNTPATQEVVGELKSTILKELKNLQKDTK